MNQQSVNWETISQKLWVALKEQCAADPLRAKRLVMVTEADIKTAIQKVCSTDVSA